MADIAELGLKIKSSAETVKALNDVAEAAQRAKKALKELAMTIEEVTKEN